MAYDLDITSKDGNIVRIFVQASSPEVLQEARDVFFGPRFEKWGHLSDEKTHTHYTTFVIEDADPVKMQNEVNPLDDVIAFYNETSIDRVELEWIPYVDAFRQGFRYTRYPKDWASRDGDQDQPVSEATLSVGFGMTATAS